MLAKLKARTSSCLRKFLLGAPLIEGNPERLKLGSGVRLVDATMNLVSGDITVGDHAVFSYGVMVLTGTHEFHAGRRVYLQLEPRDDGSGVSVEVPTSGRDIFIGAGCYVGARAIILGGVSIGDHSIVAANSVVTKSFPPHSVVAGVPAKKVGDTRDGVSSLILE